jgi:hypothetical protein
MKSGTTFVQLTVLSASQTPGVLQESIGLAADIAWTKGEPREHGGVHGQHGLRYGSGLGPQATLNEHLARLIERLSSSAGEIRALVGCGDVMISCALYREASNIGVFVDADLLERISALGASLDLDIYSLTDDAPQ